MARIIVVPERLQDMSRQMSQAARNLYHLDGHLGRVLGGMDWQVRQQANIEGQIQAVRNQARALAEQAEAMARFLAEQAVAFQQADEEGASRLCNVAETFQQSILTPLWDTMISINQQARPIVRLGQFLIPLAPAIVIGLSMKPGVAYVGEVIIDLPNWLRNIMSLRKFRELVGLPGHFNHFKVTNFPSHLLKWGIVFSVPEIIWKWYTDFREYRGTKLLSAIAVDALLTLAPVGASYIVASIITAALTTLAAPAVVTAATALILGIAANLAIKWAIEQYDIRERAMEAVSQGIQTVGRTVDRAFRPVVQGIVEAFQRLTPVTP